MKVANFHDRLNQALKERKMTQNDLSEKTGINKGNMSRYCNGLKVPKLDKIEQFAKILNVNPTWLIGYDVPMNPNTTYKDKIMNKIDTLKESDLEKVYNILETLYPSD